MDGDKISNEQAKTIMYVSMEPQQIAASGVCDTAHELWLKLKENHEGALTNLRSSSLAEFLALKYKRGESIINFSGRFENSLGRLESTGHKVDEKTKLWVYSNSLPQNMKLTVQIFTIANPEGKVKDLISQMKIQYHLESQEGDDAAYQAVERKQNQQRNIACTYCKRMNHGWKECKKLKFDNERKKKFGQHQYQQRNKFNNNQHNRANQLNQDRNLSGAFNVKPHNFTEDRHVWIIDSGASSHITPHREYLTNYQEFLVPRNIFLDDGKGLKV